MDFILDRGKWITHTAGSGSESPLCFLYWPQNINIGRLLLWLRVDFVCLRRRLWHPTPVLLPGKSHGRRSLVGCSPWGRWESDTIEQLHFHFSLSWIGEGTGNPLQYLYVFPWLSQKEMMLFSLVYAILHLDRKRDYQFWNKWILLRDIKLFKTNISDIDILFIILLKNFCHTFCIFFFHPSCWLPGSVVWCLTLIWGNS